MSYYKGILDHYGNKNVVTFDVCNDTQLLVQLIADMFLDSRYFLAPMNVKDEVKRDQVCQITLLRQVFVWFGLISRVFYSSGENFVT